MSYTNSGVGIAGVNTPTLINSVRQAAMPSMVGIAGEPSRPKLAVVQSGVGVAGNLSRQSRAGVLPPSDVATIQRADRTQSTLSMGDNGLGDRAARHAWQRATWYIDWSFMAFVERGTIRWRKGREEVFGRAYRQMPLGLECGGYRRWISNTAPAWARNRDLYPAVIDLVDPDLYAAWDSPDRQQTLLNLHWLIDLFPSDVANGRMWPIFVCGWNSPAPSIPPGSLPWPHHDRLERLIPLNRTQKRYTSAQREVWAQLAVHQAWADAHDPDFKWMVETFGRVMIGGMIGGSLPRIARHLYCAVLSHLWGS